LRVKGIIILLVLLGIVGGYFGYTHLPKPKQSNDKPSVWQVSMDDLQKMQIDLVSDKGTKSERFVKQPDESWRFDDLQLSAINPDRWGGGIPLLLSGPHADRIIYRAAPNAKLTEFGLTQPRMTITLTLNSGRPVVIKVGDTTPSGQAFYVQVPDSNDVCTVDYSWYGVVQRLVTDPPYAVAETIAPPGG
jgi:hypothetical protein